MAGASVSGTTTWASQILSYKVLIVLTDLLRSVRHSYVVTDQLAHLFGRDDPLFSFFAAAALKVRRSIAAAQYFHDRAFQFCGLARQLEGVIEQHRDG